MYRLLCALYFVSTASFALEVIPERPEIIYTNENYVKNVKASVRRPSRNSKYVLNIDLVTLQQWNKNVTFHFNIYENLHNEYKISFVNIPDMNFCEVIKFQLFQKTLENTMVKCPLPAGHIHVPNLTLAIPDFPYTWPFEKCKARLTVKAPKGIIMVIGDLYHSLKQTTKKKP
ncbi:uncharacterized protein LOC110385085 isoform X1 [Bombyx mori]|uniref:MD-2-related lipid-recognition domain-containing protein n=1 Tax=Bombyx mori TaxID=7091 RepID=A0A8R2DK11_BOMMO|nr:uncharacterized protein LOC110385085 [Bombyx mori]